MNYDIYGYWVWIRSMVKDGYPTVSRDKPSTNWCRISSIHSVPNGIVALVIHEYDSWGDPSKYNYMVQTEHVAIPVVILENVDVIYNRCCSN